MTALQELIEELEKEILDIGDESSSKDLYFRGGLRGALNMAQEKLEKEKEQIVTAFTDGASWELYGYNIPYEERCLKYYKETYGN